MLHYTDTDTYMKQFFGRKVYRLSLNGGFTCPNRDGTLGTRGCTFCSAGGSGEFAASSALSIEEQLLSAENRIAHKLPKHAPVGYMAYFQAYTNTYAPVETLRYLFMDALLRPEIVALSVATRPDCLGPEVIALLSELNQIKPVFVELGLQTIHERTAQWMRRGYSFSVFTAAVEQLSAVGIRTTVHLILGLPNESIPEMLESVRSVCSLPIHGLKLQLLHILKGTDLAEEYLALPEVRRSQVFRMLNREVYLDTVVSCVALVPENIVLYRLTGDGDKRLLIAPLWSGDKKAVLNDLRRRFASYPDNTR